MCLRPFGVWVIIGTFSIAFTANGKRLVAVWGFPFAVVTKIDFSMALTSFDGKRYILGEIFIFFKVFWDKAIPPFSTSSPWEHNGFFVFRKNRGKYPRNLLIISGPFWPSLGQLGRQHHVLATVWPFKRHFLEIEEGIHWYRTPELCFFASTCPGTSSRHFVFNFFRHWFSSF